MQQLFLKILPDGPMIRTSSELSKSPESLTGGFIPNNLASLSDIST